MPAKSRQIRLQSLDSTYRMKNAQAIPATGRMRRSSFVARSLVLILGLMEMSRVVMRVDSLCLVGLRELGLTRNQSSVNLCNADKRVIHKEIQ